MSLFEWHPGSIQFSDSPQKLSLRWYSSRAWWCVIYWPPLSARRKKLKEMVGRVGSILKMFVVFWRAGRCMFIIFFFSFDHSLNGVSDNCRASAEPHQDVVGQDTLNGAVIEGHRQMLLQVDHPEYSQEGKSLLYLLDQTVLCVCVMFPDMFVLRNLNCDTLSFYCQYLMIHLFRLWADDDPFLFS